MVLNDSLQCPVYPDGANSIPPPNGPSPCSLPRFVFLWVLLGDQCRLATAGLPLIVEPNAHFSYPSRYSFSHSRSLSFVINGSQLAGIRVINYLVGQASFFFSPCSVLFFSRRLLRFFSLDPLRCRRVVSLSELPTIFSMVLGAPLCGTSTKHACHLRIFQSRQTGS